MPWRPPAIPAAFPEGTELCRLGGFQAWQPSGISCGEQAFALEDSGPLASLLLVLAGPRGGPAPHSARGCPLAPGSPSSHSARRKAPTAHPWDSWHGAWAARALFLCSQRGSLHGAAVAAGGSVARSPSARSAPPQAAPSRCHFRGRETEQLERESVAPESSCSGKEEGCCLAWPGQERCHHRGGQLAPAFSGEGTLSRRHWLLLQVPQGSGPGPASPSLESSSGEPSTRVAEVEEAEPALSACPRATCQ